MQLDRIDGRPQPGVEPPARERVFGRALRVGAWLGLGLLLGASAAAAFDSGREQACAASSVSALPSVTADGFRCETRHLAREVSFRNFVIDRVTECRPLVSFCPGGSGSMAREAASPRALAADAASGPSPADRVARWTVDRARIANAQYDRSLRGLAGRFVRAAP